MSKGRLLKEATWIKAGYDRDKHTRFPMRISEVPVTDVCCHCGCSVQLCKKGLTCSFITDTRDVLHPTSPLRRQWIFSLWDVALVAHACLQSRQDGIHQRSLLTVHKPRQWNCPYFWEKWLHLFLCHWYTSLTDRMWTTSCSTLGWFFDGYLGIRSWNRLRANDSVGGTIRLEVSVKFNSLIDDGSNQFDIAVWCSKYDGFSIDFNACHLMRRSWPTVQWKGHVDII